LGHNFLGQRCLTAKESIIAAAELRQTFSTAVLAVTPVVSDKIRVLGRI
jgi:hypothetical protein